MPLCGPALPPAQPGCDSGSRAALVVMADIFLSYAREDEARAAVVAPCSASWGGLVPVLHGAYTAAGSQHDPAVLAHRLPAEPGR